MARRPATLDASDPRMPLGVFHLCACGQRVILAWEQACPACRATSSPREVAAAPVVSRPPPRPPTPTHVPTGSGSTPRPTAVHAIAPPPPAQGTPEGRSAVAPAPRATTAEAPRRTVKLDLAPLRSTPVAPSAPSSAAPKRTVMLSLPTPASPSAELVLAWAPPEQADPPGWTIEGVAADGTPVTLYLRWQGGRWNLLEATGAEADDTTLHALGVARRSGRP